MLPLKRYASEGGLAPDATRPDPGTTDAELEESAEAVEGGTGRLNLKRCDDSVTVEALRFTVDGDACRQ